MAIDIHVQEEQVNVEVSNAGGGGGGILQEVTIYENGEYTPEEGYDGFSKVIVETPQGVLPSAEEGSF